MAKRGRKKLNLDRPKVREYIGIGLSIREIGRLMDCDHKTISNNFSPILKKRNEKESLERHEKRKKLREAQWDAAINDKNPLMLIWLGKNELGQQDKLDTEDRKEVVITIKRLITEEVKKGCRTKMK